mmetsp:Transcript_6578/g.21941  ORF Transcript_6578/g.21941 Transcript_6578/m.21941 type:complete len:96 (+) Transcript_6578:214-501(+)
MSGGGLGGGDGAGGGGDGEDGGGGEGGGGLGGGLGGGGANSKDLTVNTPSSVPTCSRTVRAAFHVCGARTTTFTESPFRTCVLVPASNHVPSTTF